MGGGAWRRGVAWRVKRLLRLGEAGLSLHLSLCPGGDVCPTEQFDSTKTPWSEALSKDPLAHNILWSCLAGCLTLHPPT